MAIRCIGDDPCSNVLEVTAPAVKEIREMATQIEVMFAERLSDRKRRLEEAVYRSNSPEDVRQLLQEVDRALDKIGKGTYGLCETCKEPIETDRLNMDPLVRYCIDHLSSSEQRALEHDISTARDIQVGLLPRKSITLPGWQSAYHYEPLGPVSGDYCDIILNETRPNSFFFIVGDVTGKGIAASILMSQLHATFRTLAQTGIPLGEIMQRANRIFCEASLVTHFATLVCGLADKNGNVEISNAGHCLPVVVKSDAIDTIPSSGLPLGISCDVKYKSSMLELVHGDRIVVYTDGLSEAADESGELYSEERLKSLLKTTESSAASDLLAASLKDLGRFIGNSKRSDDLTILVLQKV